MEVPVDGVFTDFPDVAVGVLTGGAGPGSVRATGAVVVLLAFFALALAL